ncbi:MAG: flagellar export protein FliJ [Deltaproteobacteria bacterium]|nr:flagellar export protein FliJ [Deltaproteobacteria bacterium]
MNKFVFKLEPLYEYRQRLQELCQKEFGEASKKLEEEETKLQALKDLHRKSCNEIDDMKERSEEVKDLHLYYDYIAGLKRHIDQQGIIINSVRAAFEKKRSELLESTKSTKVIEVIKEKHLDIYNHALNKEEQKTNDDLVTSRFKRSGV